ncbi:MAG TPA: hypothetical protein VF173_04705 [Thermoanaerobaculia bacterium]|nr:hypothetical protein [Thermoanaerobaculia bacterium]
MTRERIGIVLVLAAAVSALRPSQAAAQTRRFSERLTIREREILVALPDVREKKSLKPGDFQVLVGGQPREVNRAEPASAADGEPPWTIVVYVDRTLASPGTVFYSALALSSRATALTGLGSVEIVVADADPRPALAATHEAKRLAGTLTSLAAAARIERDRASRRLAPPGPPDVPLLRRQLDKLLSLLTSRTPSGPHAVLLVMDGLDLPDEQIADLDKSAAGAPQTAAAALQRTARLLAAYGWVAIPVPLRKEGPGDPASMQSDLETFRENTAWSGHSSSVPPTVRWAPPKATSLAFRGVIDLMIAPQTAALRALARPTAGTVIGFEVQLDEALQALARRWRLWIAEPDAPVDGRLHPLAVGLPGKLETVRAPEWLRSSTPEEIAEVRLADLLAARPGSGGLELNASVASTPAGPELRLAVAPIELPEGAPPGPLRISYAWSGPDGPTGTRHETLAPGDLAQGWQHAERLAPPAGARRLAVTVEALGPEKWGGAVLAVE